MSKHVVIGDIHGCFDELQDLLERIGLAADDQIIALGDIVDRGPDSAKVLEFFRDTPNAISLMGNHERKHLLSARGETQAALSQRIVKAQCCDRYTDWLAFMETFPRHVELPEAILVHGMFEPGVPLVEQRDTVVIGTLTGERYMRQHYPDPWYDQYMGPKPLVVGHHIYLRTGKPLIREGLLYAIDTGVAHGGRLTALILPGFNVVSVPSRGDHWAQARRSHARSMDSKQPVLDLDWQRLARLADAVGLAGHRRERAQRCAAVQTECARIVVSALSAIRSRCIEIIDELAHTSAWERSSPCAQVALYARHVRHHPLAELLNTAHRSQLSEMEIYRHFRSPRRLAQMAQQLQIESWLLDE